MFFSFRADGRYDVTPTPLATSLELRRATPSRRSTNAEVDVGDEAAALRSTTPTPRRLSGPAAIELLNFQLQLAVALASDFAVPLDDFAVPRVPGDTSSVRCTPSPTPLWTRSLSVWMVGGQDFLRAECDCRQVRTFPLSWHEFVKLTRVLVLDVSRVL